MGRIGIGNPPWRDRSLVIGDHSAYLEGFLIASALIGVKTLTKLPSGSRNKSERFPQGIVVGA